MTCSSCTVPSGPTAARRPGRRLLWVGVVVLAAAAVTGAGLAFAPGCGAFNRHLDGLALEGVARAVAERGLPARSDAPLPFETVAELERLTRPSGPLVPRFAPLETHRRNDAGLVEEAMSFESAVAVRHGVSNVARAHVYRHGRLGERPVVLWVPGQAVSEAAFTPVGWFFDEILSRGADVVFYVPPYHLERAPDGDPSGDAFFATDFADHLAVHAQGISDLRRLVRWLREDAGAPALGAFGGSMGASWLLRLSTWDDGLDFLTVMIPVIRWDEMVLGTVELEPVRARLAAEGVDEARLRRVYGALDPSGAKSHVPPERISVLYGRYDRVTPEAAVLSWARAWGVERIRAYDRGHALILATPAMYRDYAAILETDLARGSAETPSL